MRLPWLQIDADGQTRARMLARLLGVPEPQGLGIALALWTWALEMAPDGDFSGAVEGDAELVAAAVSWPIERAGELIAQLQRVGFMATVPALRVRGLERYRRTWEKNRRKGHGKDNSADSGGAVPGPARVPPVSRQNPARKTETETEKKEDLLGPVPPKPPKPPRKLSAAEDFFAWLRATRAGKTPLSDSPLAPAAINKTFGAALLEHGRPNCERAYVAFLALPEPGGLDPPWPWQSFLARLPMLARSAPLTPKPESRSFS